MLRWLIRTLGIFIVILLMVYGCVYGVDYLTFEEWVGFTLFDGTPLTHPTELSEKDYVFLMWTDPECKYCVAQLQALNTFAIIEGLAEVGYDVILVYSKVPLEVPSDVLVVLGPPKGVLPFTEFFIKSESGAWTEYLAWSGYYSVEEMKQLFLEVKDDNEKET